jgi:hypothetical protein
MQRNFGGGCRAKQPLAFGVYRIFFSLTSPKIRKKQIDSGSALCYDEKTTQQS